MRVLLVADYYLPVLGGLEIHLDALAAELSELGHEVHVATMTRGARATDRRVTVHEIDNALANRLPYHDGERRYHLPVPDVRSHRQLGAVVDAVRPDIIDVHNWLGVSLPRRHRPPVVFTAQDYALVCHIRTLFTQPDGQICSGPSPARCLRCGTAGRGLPGTLVMGGGTVVGRHWLRPDAVIACSDYVADRLRGSVRAPIHAIPNFAHPVAPAVAPGVLPPDGYVMFAGQPGRHKGLDLLLDLWAAPHPPSAPLLVASTLPVDAGLPAGVIVRRLMPAEVAAAWERAAVAVVPSRWAEPFGMTAVEAMRAGTPTIVSATGGLRDIVRDGVDGIHVPAGDAVALREALDRLLADPALRGRMGAAARERAETYAARAVTLRVVDVYTSVIDAHRR